MSVINQNLLLTPEGYQISRSVRLRSSASAYFNRTPAGAGTSNKTFTYSAWVKRGSLGSFQNLISSPNTGNSDSLRFNTSDQLEYIWQDTSLGQVTTTQVFRDPSAWYHVMFAMDTTQATAANRFKLYVNGVQVTTFTTASYPAQNTVVNNTAAVATKLGQYANASSQSFDGYLTEVNFIDGQALTPSSFGETDAVTGVWKPKKYTGTYGTNGFYLNFSDNSNNTAATIGKDWSGNGNNWTPNNISVTSGVTYDSMLDTPTPYADGGNGRGNYAVVNPLFRNSANITDGNLNFYNGALAWKTGQATTALPAQKTYFEATATLIGGANSGVFIGIATALATQDTYQVANQWSFGGTGGALKLYNQTTLVTPTGSSAAGDTFQVAYDGSTGNLWFGKNNIWYDSTGGTTGNPSTGANPTMTLTAGTEVFPCAICYGNGLNFTFGQRPFAYTPPTGFKALNTQNLPDSTIKKGSSYFNAVTYAGNNSSKVITGVGFQPDLLWFKSRASVYSHAMIDSVRGRSKVLQTNLTSAEATTTSASNDVVSFDSDGFTLGPAEISSSINNDTSIASWAWKESVSAGFDIVTYTGTGALRTIAHSLGVAPKMVIVKSRSAGSTNWCVQHASVGNNYVGYMNLTNAFTTNASMWNNTSPTSSVFTVNTNTDVNGNGTTYVAYLFAEVAGYSKFGSYTGNGSTDGPFVYLGFRPRFILIKASSAVQSWHMIDTARDTYNLAGQGLDANTSAAEYTPASSGFPMDILSNGFKIRYASEPNVSGATYIYAAFAENPFKNSLAR